MVRRESIENLESGAVLRYNLRDGGKGYFIVSRVEEGEVYGAIVKPSEYIGSVSVNVVYNREKLEKATGWEDLE